MRFHFMPAWLHPRSGNCIQMCMALLFLGCALVVLHLSSSSVLAARGDTLIYGRGGDSDSLDPARSAQSEAIKVLTHIFDTLVAYDAKTGGLVPALAASWSLSDDQRRWTFELRKNVRFHDGTPLNAEAVRYSLSRLIDSSHPQHRSDFPYAAFFASIKEIQVLSPLEVSFVLYSPFAPFLYNLSLPSAGIVSPAALERWGDEFGEHPVGTGPFVFERWLKDDVILLTRNRGYWGEGPHVEQLIFKTILKDADRLLALKAGAIHLMDSFSFSVIEEFNKDPNLELHSGPGLNVGYLAINTQRKPFDNLMVRQALNMAIDKKRLIKLFCQGVAIPAITPIPPGEWAYNDEIEDYVYDPVRAKALLAEAGYPNGFSANLLQSPVSRSYIPHPGKFARYIQAQLRAVGVDIEVVELNMGDFLHRTNVGDYDLVSMGWTGDNGDPDNFFFSMFYSGHTHPPTILNKSLYRSDQLDELLLRAQTTTEIKERTTLYKEIQKHIHQEAPWVPLAHGQVLLASRKSVKGIQLMPLLPNVRLEAVRLVED